MDSSIQSLANLAGRVVGVIALGHPPPPRKRDLPETSRKRVFADYLDARKALAAGEVDAVYGDACYLRADDPENGVPFRLLIEFPNPENHVVAVAQGHDRLLAKVDEVVAAMHGEIDGRERKSQPTISLHDLWEEPRTLPHGLGEGRDLRRLRKRGFLRVGLRTDTPADGLEVRLARRIAKALLGDEGRLEIILTTPARRFRLLRSKSSWLNWAWRFWGTTTLIANANWWYLGTSGRLPEELCPREAVGAQDFIGLDYYWGLPTWRLHRFRLLGDAAHGRFLQAPVWPQGLYHSLRRMHRWFPGMEIFVVENGSVPEASGVSRSSYLRQHLKQTLKALKKGVPVIGYNFWSITSNREWGHPFDPNTDFGLHFVDLDHDADLTRHPTADVASYRDVILTRELRGNGDEA
jgi:hypothetical protein